MSLESELKKLKCKRGYLKSQLTCFEKALAKINANELTTESVIKLKQRLQKIEPIIDEFNNIELEMQCLSMDDPEICEVQLNEREAFEEMYFSLTSKAQALIEVTDESTSRVNTEYNVSQRQPKCNIKLPAIKLITFDGAFTEWRSFYDSFNSLIHTNSELSNVQKITYLKSSLKGEPYGLISTLESTDLNYEIAWNLLNKRYDNKRRIVNNHVQAILNIPTTVKESANHLREVVNSVQTHINCLQALNQSVGEWDALLVPILLGKLDGQTIKEWETKLNNETTTNDVPTVGSLLEFIINKQTILETVHQKGERVLQGNRGHSVQNSRNSTRSLVTVETSGCINCEGNHSIMNCETFLEMNATDRSKRIRELKACVNCLRKGHFAHYCKSPVSCKKCNKHHHSLLHFSATKQTTSVEKDIAQATNDQAVSLSVTSQQVQFQTQTLLSTATILIKGSDNVFYKARALLDSASQSNFITDGFVRKLNLKKDAINLNVVGIGQGTIGIRNKVDVNLKSRYDHFETLIQCLVVSQITPALPSITLNTKIKVPSHIKLADQHFYESQDVDLLLGAGIFWSLICVGQVQEQGLTFQKTKLGWIVSGELIREEHALESTKFSYVTLNEIDQNLQNFWKLDEFIVEESPLTDNERFCENHFIENTERDCDGRFIVKFPFKSNVNKVGDTYDLAKSRLLSLENRFKREPKLKTQYFAFMNEYINLKHMSKSDNHAGSDFYIPHHCVIKDSSETTKLRVVFDGSCKPQYGLSLNETQHVGPKLQNDIVSIIMRFRLYEYVLTGDIAKMYRQIWIHPEHRKYQKILWRQDASEPMSTYVLNTVTYGTTAAPYLAIRCLIQTAIDNQNKYPQEAEIIRRDFYVDDLITGSDNLDTLIQIKANLQKILSLSGFVLRKFKSNTSALSDEIEASSLTLNEGDCKTLGVSWNPKLDHLSYSFKIFDFGNQVTKRTILAITAQMYDPLGLLSPVIVIAKLIIQHLWQLKLTWDESIPLYLHKRWLNFKDNLSVLNKLSLPRKIILNDYKRIELHTFSDASEKAYGACIYIKSISSQDEVMVSLVAAKSRVAPLKVITVPRLELSAATLSVQLASKVKKMLNLKFDREFFWCDSTITLSWLKTDSIKWKTFVANRVTEIQRLSNSNDWYHVASKDNAADLISRGVPPDKILSTTLWWKGPLWLSQISVETKTFDLTISNVPEHRKVKTLQFHSVTFQDAFPIGAYSSFIKLTHVVAYCLRFKENCRNPQSKLIGPLTVTECDNALKTLIKLIQQTSFRIEFETLKSGKPLNPKSNILGLTPFIDSENIIRVGGRLKLSTYDFDKKHPILLPKGHYFNIILFKHYHEKLFHAGPSFLLSSIRERFWPIAGGVLAKRTVKGCVRCTRFNARSVTQIMGNLPLERTLAMHPFHAVGIDYAGPYLIKTMAARSKIKLKAYVCLFICLSTKALHLELVTDLTTQSFLLTLKRFIARRGKPQKIFSDNGKTFIGAKNELQELGKFLESDSDSIQEIASTEGISWSFIPPRAPNFGGLWEAGVRRVKYHLKRILSNTLLNYEEFSTILVQIESLINSRPLTPLSSDPNDMEVLTPAHFLIGRTFVSVPDPNVSDLVTNKIKRHQMLQRLQGQFWDKWSREYLHHLQQKTKWKAGTSNLQVGTMVLIKEGNLPPAQWLLGRISKIHPGADGVIRVVSVKCKSGELKRSARNICVLPIEREEQ